MSSSRRFRPSQSTIMYTNAVYFPSNAVYSGHTPAQLNYSCISLVYYAYAHVSEAGHVYLGDDLADLKMPCDGANGALGSLLHLKQQHPYLQVIVSIGGTEFSSVFATVAANPVYRDNFARSALALIEASGIDGVDINWLFPIDPQQAADFTALLCQVRMYLGEDQYYLTTTLPPGKDSLRIFDLPSIASYVDLINLAAYDFYTVWSPRSGHHAQLYAVGKDEISGASSVQYLMSHGVPSKKILLGIPLYGRSFMGPAATGPGQPFTSGGGDEGGTFYYYDLPRHGTHEHVNRRVVGAQCVGGDGGFVSYDNPETVREKAEFARQKSLAGLYYWSAPYDSQDMKRSLIATGFRALHGT
ncbi:hypothetical protein SEUCBS139899_010841 [Sporothrix eucalyptigena]|uniref:chitinase n=1 Tax=Sporothrix eucalyptigena TaxID=1812306 RepID=A0ABP0D1L8_9PEZI